MKLLIFFLCIPLVSAVSIGVSPDQIYVENGQASFSILNPNKELIWYDLDTVTLIADKKSGMLRPNERRKVILTTPFIFDREHITVTFSQPTNHISPSLRILVETNPKEELKKGAIVMVLIAGGGVILFLIFYEKL